jgi:hypothetical protein
MNKYTHTEMDSWTWSRATNADVPDIVKLVDTNYSDEIDKIIFTKNPTRLHYHLHQAILDQTYNLNTHSIAVARDTNNKLIAWSWIARNKYTVYADQEMAVAEFAHVDLTLSTRIRIRLLAQIIEQWVCWAELHKIPVLCSTTIRTDQTVFMRLHEQFGFVCRGSTAYKKIF